LHCALGDSGKDEDDAEKGYFGIPALDDLVASQTTSTTTRREQQQQPTQQQQSANTDPASNTHENTETADPISNSGKIKYAKPPLLEIISPPPNLHPSPAGKTSLVYLITAHAILPPELMLSLSSSPVHLGGQNAAVVVLDPLGHFCVRRLAQVIAALIKEKLHESEFGHAVPTGDEEEEVKTVIRRALVHVHLYRPQSWTSLLATLQQMPGYLFNADRHRSMDRRVHSIVLEDVHVFYHSVKSCSKDTHDDNDSVIESANPGPLATANTNLTSVLQRLEKIFACAIVLTSPSSSPTFFRPRIPYSWPPDTALTRIAVRRIDIIPFAPGRGVEEAERDRAARQEVVDRKRFEAWRVGDRERRGFVFSVKGVEGVGIESNENSL
jgi:hypothetical protein